jgi:regulator of RNase E activity RraA
VTEPWELAVTPVAARDVPADLRERFRTQADIVEELSDRLRAQLGIESSVDLGPFDANRTAFHHVGTVVTVRYAPKTIVTNEQRLAHDRIAGAVPPGAIVVTDARGTHGSVLGGNAAVTIAGGGAAVAIVDGLARDIPEVDASGLIVLATTFGIQTGRPSIQAVEIGGCITFRERLVTSGDVGIVNRHGFVTIPAWLAWDDVRALLG